ncbi:poly polymerase [Phytophthora cinnamomi]|uniref:poly polymerase n=1 Tax=Phytophthora cinnamomi TaxID=4785 RepID=UPI0035597FAB|nr:poly polymerase [Phytophthora cinnamomi]
MGMGSPNSKDEGGRKTARLSDGERPSLGFADTGSSQKVLGFDESGKRARVDLIEDHYADQQGKEAPQEGSDVQMQAFRSEQPDGSVVTKTVRTTRTTARSSAGDYVTTIEVQTTTETETKDGAKSTTVSTETSTETVSGQVATCSEGDSAAETGGDDVQTQVFRSVESDGSIVTKTVRTTRRTVVTNGVATTTVEVQTTTETEGKDGAKTTSVSTETHTEIEGGSLTSATEEKAPAALDEVAESEHGGRRSFMLGKKRKYHKQWHPQFVSYLDRQEKRIETLPSSDLLEYARAFCRDTFSEFRPELFDGESNENSKASWEVVAQLAAYYPMVAVQLLAQDVGKKNLLIMDEITQGFDSENRLRKEWFIMGLGKISSSTFATWAINALLANELRNFC